MSRYRARLPAGVRNCGRRAICIAMGEESKLYVEEWQAHYGGPLQVDGEDVDGAGVLVEASDTLALTPEPVEAPGRLAFVDGARRGDAFLYLEDMDTGALAYGVAGAHACGAVLCESERVRCEHMAVDRLAIWGSGQMADLPAGSAGYRWRSVSIADTEHDAPLRALQRRMRNAEGKLAERLAEDGWTVVCDGPLNYARSTDLPVCGFVKTHRRPLLPADQRPLIGELGRAQRTPLFAISDRYSCYVRLVVRGPGHGPWHGVARIELSQSVGIAVARRTADMMALILPRYAGIAHVDPRAPQNLQPIGALEAQLRHRLGHPRQAALAVHAAAASARVSTPVGGAS
jgi:hypothetical protein